MDTTELQHRIKNAIVLLKDGHFFKVGDLSFSCRDNKHFSVIGWTVSIDLKSINKKSALMELNEIKELFNNMKSASPELTDFIKEREIEYRLGFDYGMGSIGICSEINGQLTWETELKE